MGEPRQPQDRLPKAVKPEAEEFFTFTASGREYTMPNKTLDVLTPGYHRKHRKMDDEDRLWTMLEDLAGGDEDILDAFDGMTRDEWLELQKAFARHAGAPGESTRSST